MHPLSEFISKLGNLPYLLSTTFQILLLLTFIVGNISAATFTVTRTSDRDEICTSGDCSLREALKAAKNFGGNHTINFDASLFSTAQMIVLTAGELSITGGGEVSIEGTSPEMLKISANNQSRVFNIVGGRVTMRNLTIADGRNDAGGSNYGGGIYNSGVLSLLNCKVSNNSVTVRDGFGGSFNDNYGGGIYNSGTLELTNTEVFENQLKMNPGFAGKTGGYGGGIFNDGGTLKAFSSKIISNRSILTGTNNGSRGGGIYNNGGSVNLIDSEVTGNSVSGGYALSKSLGGGIFTSGGSINIVGGGVFSNFAYGGSYQSSYNEARGAGIFIGGGTVKISRAKISGNQINNNGANYYGTMGSNSFGGAVYNDGSVEIADTEIAFNIAGGSAAVAGAGIYNNGQIVISGSSINRNSDNCFNPYQCFGGGIYNNGSAEITNSTVSTNRITFFAPVAPDDIFRIAQVPPPLTGAAIFNKGEINLTGATVTGNSSYNVGGPGDIIEYQCAVNNDSGTINSANSIIARNGSPEIAELCGLFVSRGYNLIRNPQSATLTGATATDLLNLDPLLAPLGNYGGLTSTHALLAASSAIDAGSNASVSAASENDQRGNGFPRINGVKVDIGAYETPGQTYVPVFLNGKIVNSAGRGVNRARIELSGGETTQTTQTNFYGYFRFGNLQPGQVYILNVGTKKNRIDPRPVTIDPNGAILEIKL